MLTRPYQRTDYQLVNQWFKQYGWTNGVPEEHLPPTGVISNRDGIPVAVGFIYYADQTHMCWIDYVCADRDIPSHKKLAAILDVLDQLKIYAHNKLGNKCMIYTVSSNPQYLSILDKVGFHTGETTMTSKYFTFGDYSKYEHVTE
jgi:hypothetical protein